MDLLLDVLLAGDEIPEDEILDLNGELLRREESRAVQLLRQPGDDPVVHPLPLAELGEPGKKEAVSGEDQAVGLLSLEDLGHVAVILHERGRVGEKQDAGAGAQVQLRLPRALDRAQRVQEHDRFSRARTAADEEIETPA